MRNNLETHINDLEVEINRIKSLSKHSYDSGVQEKLNFAVAYVSGYLSGIRKGLQQNISAADNWMAWTALTRLGGDTVKVELNDSAKRDWPYYMSDIKKP